MNEDDKDLPENNEVGEAAASENSTEASEKNDTKEREESRSPRDEQPGGSDHADEAPEIPETMPFLPLKDTVVFSSMIVPLLENRDKGLRTIEAVLSGNRYIYLAAQRDPSADDPEPSQMYGMGTVALILRQVRLPDGQAKFLVQGVSRASAVEYDTSGPVPYVRIHVETEPPASTASSAEIEALMNCVREQSEKILQLRGLPTSEIMAVLNGVNDPGKLADIVTSNIRMTVDDAQRILECLDPIERLRQACRHLFHESEVASIQAKIQAMARESMEKSQKEYILREQLKAIHKELGDDTNEEEEQEAYKKKFEKAGLPEEARNEAEKQLRRLRTMHSDSAEATVVRTYLDLLAELPWKKKSRDRIDIEEASKSLDRDHYGLEKAKERILDFLSVRKIAPNTKGPVLCFAGPPGVGKTSLGHSIAKAAGRKFQRISLGGIHDEAEIRGHRRTYIGAMPGRLIQAVRKAGTKNPVIVLDEIDKLGSDHRGDPASALLEALDPEQNSHFSDHYLNLEFDLSGVLFICTANQLDTIPPALRDRMEIIELPGYTEQEKLAIASHHLVGRQCEANGLKKSDVKFKDSALAALIRGYTREAGVRNLEREIGSVCRKIARCRAEGGKGSYTVDAKAVEKFLGRKLFADEKKREKLIPGVALGLAWTQAGGEVLHIEAAAIPGKGSIQLTGKLGEVMQESARAAVTWTRAHAKELGIEEDFHEKFDIHIHVPAGATPKDGPSAGVTITAALVSALSGRPLRSDTCMTGEISLRGRILPVGGIKEKLLGASARGLKRVCIPAMNAADLEDIPEEMRKKLSVHPVETLEELLPLIFDK